LLTLRDILPVMRELRLAVRSLLRSPAFTVTAVLSLALAVGGSAAAFSVLDAVRFRALPFRDADRLVLLSEIVDEPKVGERAMAMLRASQPASGAQRGTSACRSACAVSYETYAQVLTRFPFKTLDTVAAFTSGLKGMATGNEMMPVTAGVVSANIFALLGVRPILGRGLLPEDDRLGVPLVTVMSYDIWQNQFGKRASVIGETIKLSDSRYVVVGVMPPGFRFESGSHFWLPTVPTLDPSTRPSIRSVNVIGRLAEGHTIDQLRQELGNVEPVQATTGSRNAGRKVLQAEPLRARYVTATRSHDVIFAAIVGCLLLIACTNLASLILVRAMHQRQEFAVRKALGADAWRVTREFLTQNTLVVGVAAAIGIGLAVVTVDVLRSFAALDTLRAEGMEYRVDARVVAFTVSVAALLVVVLSVIPARLLIQADVQRVLRETAAGVGSARVSLQRAFVALQIAFTLVLLIGAALMAKSALHFGRVSLGFDAHMLVSGTPSYPHPWRVPEKYLAVTEDIVSQLSAIPGVANAAVRVAVPLSAGSLTLQGADKPLAAALSPTSATAVTPDYFSTVGVRVVSGRAFDTRDVATGAPVAIVNQWAARRWWPQQTAVGQIVTIDTGSGRNTGRLPVTVVAVVADNRAARGDILLADDGPELYRPYLQAHTAFPTFLVRATSSPATLLKPVHETLVRLVPDRPAFTTLPAETVATQLRGVRVSAVQVLGFAAVGLVLALIGVYGVLAYEVGQRGRELGIRAALGASRSRITLTTLLDAARLAAIGVAIGIPAAIVALRPLRDALHPTSPTDVGVYALVAAAIVVIAMFAAYLPARRAGRIDPIVVVKGS
jgi:putative ABC transport system permease protein